MNENYKKYFAIWFHYYSNNGFGGMSVETAASYAAMDCLNMCKNYRFNQSEIDDDIAYYQAKTGYKPN